MLTARVDPVDTPSARIGPCAVFFFLWVGGTLILLLLVWMSDPSAFASNGPIGLVVGGGIWGIWCLAGYLVEGRGYGLRFRRFIY